jgi:hypothetical protein
LDYVLSGDDPDIFLIFCFYGLKSMQPDALIKNTGSSPYTIIIISCHKPVNQDLSGNHEWFFDLTPGIPMRSAKPVSPKKTGSRRDQDTYGLRTEI